MDAYDYGLPEPSIAQAPVEPRSAARLLIGPGLGRVPSPAHASMADLPGLLRPGDVVVVNDTRVLAARLSLVKASGGRAEVLLIEPLTDPGPVSSDGTVEWKALVRPGKRLPAGTRLFESGGTAPVVEVGEEVDRAESGARW